MAQWFQQTGAALQSLGESVRQEQRMKRSPQYQLAIERLMQAKQQAYMLSAYQEKARQGTLTPADILNMAALKGEFGLHQQQEIGKRAVAERKFKTGQAETKFEREGELQEDKQAHDLELERLRQTGRTGLETQRSKTKIEVAGIGKQASINNLMSVIAKMPMTDRTRNEFIKTVGIRSGIPIKPMVSVGRVSDEQIEIIGKLYKKKHSAALELVQYLDKADEAGYDWAKTILNKLVQKGYFGERTAE